MKKLSLFMLMGTVSLSGMDEWRPTSFPVLPPGCSTLITVEKGTYDGFPILHTSIPNRSTTTLIVSEQPLSFKDQFTLAVNTTRFVETRAVVISGDSVAKDSTVVTKLLDRLSLKWLLMHPTITHAPTIERIIIMGEGLSCLDPICAVLPTQCKRFESVEKWRQALILAHHTTADTRHLMLSSLVSTIETACMKVIAKEVSRSHPRTQEAKKLPMHCKVRS